MKNSSPSQLFYANFDSFLNQYFSLHQGFDPPPGLYHHVMGGVERKLLIKTMAFTDNNQRHAARILGINRNTLRKKLIEQEIGKET